MSTAESPRASEQAPDRARLIVVMGVAGCGKSTVAEALAARLGAACLEGDAFHPPANIARMSRGEPLTDADRWPWLDRLAAAMAAREGRVVAACSALRRAYRRRLIDAAGEPVAFVHLVGDRALVAARMAARQGHFMPPSLLDSQFATLEPPGPEEAAVTVDIAAPPAEVVARALAALAARAA